MVKTAPAATDSPIDPAVRAMFSSSSDPFQARTAAMAITAAGYVAAIVMPARSPRYAFAAPRITVRKSPSSRAFHVNSVIFMFSGTNGTCFFGVPGSALLIGGILLGRGMKAKLKLTLRTHSKQRRTLARGNARKTSAIARRIA